MCGSDGKAWIIDPAAYVGDFEADLAMTQLFGGFPTEFYSAYNEVNPISVDYPQKRDFLSAVPSPESSEFVRKILFRKCHTNYKKICITQDFFLDNFIFCLENFIRQEIESCGE